MTGSVDTRNPAAEDPAAGPARSGGRRSVGSARHYATAQPEPVEVPGASEASPRKAPFPDPTPTVHAPDARTVEPYGNETPDTSRTRTAPPEGGHLTSERLERRATHRSSGPVYVREPRRHHTQPPVDDMRADDELSHNYAYDSAYTVSGRGHRSSAYRRARTGEARVRQELKYGQYLSVPKGNREIFSSRSRSQHRRAVMAVAVVIVVLLVALIILWPK